MVWRRWLAGMVTSQRIPEPLRRSVSISTVLPILEPARYNGEYILFLAVTQ